MTDGTADVNLKLPHSQAIRASETELASLNVITPKNAQQAALPNARIDTKNDSDTDTQPKVAASSAPYEPCASFNSYPEMPTQEAELDKAFISEGTQHSVIKIDTTESQGKPADSQELV